MRLGITRASEFFVASHTLQCGFAAKRRAVRQDDCIACRIDQVVNRDWRGNLIRTAKIKLREITGGNVRVGIPGEPDIARATGDGEFGHGNMRALGHRPRTRCSHNRR
jgi:hypothetical protein